MGQTTRKRGAAVFDGMTCITLYSLVKVLVVLNCCQPGRRVNVAYVIRVVVTGVTVQTSTASPGTTVSDCGNVALSTRTGGVATVEADRVDQNSELVGIAKTVVGTSATGSLVVGEGIGIQIGTGMTPGAIGAILGVLIDVNAINVNTSCVQVGAVAVSADFR